MSLHRRRRRDCFLRPADQRTANWFYVRRYSRSLSWSVPGWTRTAWLRGLQAPRQRFRPRRFVLTHHVHDPARRHRPQFLPVPAPSGRSHKPDPATPCRTLLACEHLRFVAPEFSDGFGSCLLKRRLPRCDQLPRPGRARCRESRWVTVAWARGPEVSLAVL